MMICGEDKNDTGNEDDSAQQGKRIKLMVEENDQEQDEEES